MMILLFINQYHVCMYLPSLYVIPLLQVRRVECFLGTRAVRSPWYDDHDHDSDSDDSDENDTDDGDIKTTIATSVYSDERTTG